MRIASSPHNRYIRLQLFISYLGQKYKALLGAFIIGLYFIYLLLAYGVNQVALRD